MKGVFETDKHQTTLTKLYAKMTAALALIEGACCDCWRFEQTVCDICQGVDPNNPAKDATTATGNHD